MRLNLRLRVVVFFVRLAQDQDLRLRVLDRLAVFLKARLIFSLRAMDRAPEVTFLYTLFAFALPTFFFADLYTLRDTALILARAFLIFFVGFAIMGVGGCFNARQLSKAMSTDVPAAIRVEINQ